MTVFYLDVTICFLIMMLNFECILCVWYSRREKKVFWNARFAVSSFQTPGKTQPFQDARNEFTHLYCKNNWMWGWSNYTSLAVWVYALEGPDEESHEIMPVLGKDDYVEALFIYNPGSAR